MRSASDAAAKASAPDFRGRPVNLSRAARRGVRQAAQLADEMNLHSFRTHADGSVTWVRWREHPPPQAQQNKKCEGEARQKTGEPSKSALARAERARSHRARMQKAMVFRCATLLRHWQHATSRLSADSGAGAPPPTEGRSPGDGPPGSTTSPGGVDGASP